MVAEIDDIASIVLGFMQHGCGCRLCCRLCLVRAWHGALESTYAGGTYYTDFMLETHGDEQYNRILNRGLGDQERDGGDKDELWHATTCATSQAKDGACADAHYDRRTTRREKVDMNKCGARNALQPTAGQGLVCRHVPTTRSGRGPCRRYT